MLIMLHEVYPNSLLVLLNTRKSLRQSYASDCGYVNREPDTAQQLAAYYKLFRIAHPIPRIPVTASAR